jgi:hypothetical protein
MKYFTDNSIAPIIAIDFDGTICIGDGYPDPHNGSVRNYAKEVINLLYDVGVKIVIWTNRKNVPCTNIKDKLLMKQWLDEMGIKYHKVNESTEFAPFKYYGRKLYAHMFVDDRGFGFNCDDDQIMLKVLYEFLIEIVGCDKLVVREAIDDIISFNKPCNEDIEHIKDKIRNWHKEDKC